MLHVDFETYAPNGIDGLTTTEYVSQAKIWCFAYALDDGEVQLWTPRLPIPEFFHHYEGLYAAWNAPFEHKVWNTLLVPYGFPPVPLERWRCIQAAAREMRLPARLDKAAKALELSAEKMSNTFMKRLGQDQKTPWCPSEWVGLYVYCKQDVAAEREAASRIGSPMDQRAWEYTELLNARGLPIDRGLVEGACHVWQEYKQSINEKYQAITGLKVTQRDKSLAWLKENIGLPIYDMQRDTLAKYLQYEPVKCLTEAAATTPDKFDALRRNLTPENRIHDTLVYHGAGTGRWSGRVFQPQNLSRGILKLDQLLAMRERVINRDVSVMDEYDEPSRALGSLIRSCIAAPNLLCSDFSQIEARGVAWISGCDSLLHDFTTGADPYVSMARRIFKDDSITKADSDKRFVGKSAVLGCMYGLGANGFKEYCARQGRDLDDSLCKQAVDIYRTANPEIPKFWRGVEDAFFRAVQKQKTTQFKGIVFSWQSDNWTTVKLPSGRILSYYRPVAGYDSNRNKVFHYTGFNSSGDPWKVKLWGGIITENCLTSETPVLTNRGWVRLDSVLDDDLIYDGESFVEHGGLVYKGEQQVIDVDGVLATPDHLFLNEDGEWQNGLEINRPCRPDLWNAYCDEDRGGGWRQVWPDEASLGVQMRMRVQMRQSRVRSSQDIEARQDAKLWMYDEGIDKPSQHKAWDESPSCVRRLEVDARPMQIANSPSMEELRRQGHHSMQAMARFIRSILGGYGTSIQTGSNPRPDQQRGQLQQAELPMGELQNTSPEQAQFSASRSSDFIKKDRHSPEHSVLQVHTRPTFDIVNCGPNHRFVVMGRSGPMIAHNCVQAFCRDIMLEAMYGLEQIGYKCVLTVHDEVLVEGSLGQTIDTMNEVMIRRPKWCPDLPIASEGWSGEFYRK